MKQAKMDKNKNIDCDKVSCHFVNTCYITLILYMSYGIFLNIIYIQFCLYDFPGNQTPGIVSNLLFELQEHYDLFGLSL